MAGRPRIADRYLVETLLGFSRAKAQANFRNEPWVLTIEEWREFWTRERWPLRGRTSHAICITRRDTEKSWSRSNCCLVDRFDAIRFAKAKQAGRLPDPDMWANAIYLE